MPERLDGVEAGLLALGELLPEEPEDEGAELGGVGSAELGVAGVCGVDGLLTQPLRIKQAQASITSVRGHISLILLYDNIGFDYLLR
ncbi:MAG: hypothetical protein V3R56_05540 [Xanthomonadales bacterium]